MTRIEQIITDIETYIDNCKFQTLSNTKIIVNKEEFESYLVELRLRVPEEIKKYQKIVGQQDAILSDARAQAQNMITDAQNQMNEIVSEHEVVQKAYERANEIIDDARKQADDIIGNAIEDSNRIRSGAIDYTDKLLANVQNAVSKAAENTKRNQEDLLATLGAVYDECTGNRESLMQSTESADQM